VRRLEHRPAPFEPAWQSAWNSRGLPDRIGNGVRRGGGCRPRSSGFRSSATSRSSAAGVRLPSRHPARHAPWSGTSLAPRPQSRQKLCDLFWDGPGDPRAALRWGLAKLRPLLDDEDRVRVVAEKETAAIALAEGELDLAAARARERVAGDPLAERGHVAVVRLLGRLRRRRDGLEQYEACRRILESAFGARPSAEMERARLALTSPTLPPLEGGRGSHRRRQPRAPRFPFSSAARRESGVLRGIRSADAPGPRSWSVSATGGRSSGRRRGW